MLNLTITCGSLVVERTCFSYSLRKITIKKGTTKRDKENTMIVMILNL